MATKKKPKKKLKVESRTISGKFHEVDVKINDKPAGGIVRLKASERSQVVNKLPNNTVYLSNKDGSIQTHRTKTEAIKRFPRITPAFKKLR